MKQRYLVTYWLSGESQPRDIRLELFDVIEPNVPLALKNVIADRESYGFRRFTEDEVIIINFWKI